MTLQAHKIHQRGRINKQNEKGEPNPSDLCNLDKKSVAPQFNRVRVEKAIIDKVGADNANV